MEITGSFELTGITLSSPPAPPPPPPPPSTLYGWGYNIYAQTAYPLFTNPVTSPSTGGVPEVWTQLAGMRRSALGIKYPGTLWAWGDNASGELGLGNTNPLGPLGSPVQQGTDSNWASVASGDLTAHAIRTDGTLWAWGVNGSGTIGNGTVGVNYSSPVQIGADTNWATVCGGYNCKAAIKTNGTLWTWGSNTFGQLGLGDTSYRYSPVQIGTDTNWSKVSVAGQFMIGIKTNGTLWSWGRNNTGQLGIGYTGDYSSPVQIGALTTWSDVTVCASSVQALNTSGERWCWGYNSNGQLGDQSVNNQISPVLADTGQSWTKISAFPNGRSFIGRKSNGTLWAWGRNTQYALGLGDTNSRSSPTQVGSDTTWTTYQGGMSNAFIATK